MIVLDASAANNIVRETPEGNAFMSLMEQGEVVIAPYLFCSEVANSFSTLARLGFVDGSTALAKMSEALDLVDEFVPDVSLLPAALAESVLHGHPAYDMFYLVLARQRAATLLTCDKRLIKICDQTGVDCTHLVDVDQ